MNRLRRLLLVLPVLAAGSWGGVGAEGETVVVTGDVEFPERYEPFVVAGGLLRFVGVTSGHVERVRIPEDRSYTARLRPGERYRVLVDRLYVARRRVPGEDHRVEPAELTVPEDGPLPEMRLRIHGREGHHRLDVRVETTSGRAVPGARLHLFGHASRDRYRVPLGVAETDRRGIASFARLPPGRAHLELVSTGPFGRTQQNLGTRRRSHAFSSEVVVGGADETPPVFVLGDAGLLSVTVDASGLPQAPAVSVWNADGTLVAGPRAQPDMPDTSALFRFPSIPPGRYRVVAHYPDGPVVFRDAEVVSGRVTPLLLARTRPAALGFDLVLRWEMIPAKVRRARFFLTALHGAFETTTYEASRGRAIRRRYGPALREGEYLLRYPALGLARRIAPSEESRWVVDLTPPKEGFLARGHRTVTVRATSGGAPLQDLFVGLRAASGKDRSSGAWMRYAGVVDGVVRFADVPAGTYELHVIDRVLGVDHGIRASVRRLRVWKDDLVLDWELGDRAR